MALVCLADIVVIVDIMEKWGKFANSALLHVLLRQLLAARTAWPFRLRLWVNNSCKFSVLVAFTMLACQVARLHAKPLRDWALHAP